MWNFMVVPLKLSQTRSYWTTQKQTFAIVALLHQKLTLSLDPLRTFSWNTGNLTSVIMIISSLRRASLGIFSHTYTCMMRDCMDAYYCSNKRRATMIQHCNLVSSGPSRPPLNCEIHYWPVQAQAERQTT